MFLVNAKDDSLVESPVRFEEIGEIASDGFGAREKRDLPLEILGGVFGIGNLTSQTVNLATIRTPAHGIGAGDDAMDAIGR